MFWQPNNEENKYLKLIAGMSVDCMMGKGTDDKETYISNLKIAIESLENKQTEGEET